MTQTEFARRAGVDPKTLRALESGERWPHAKTRLAIEQALEWPAGTIADLADRPDIDLVEVPTDLATHRSGSGTLTTGAASSLTTMVAPIGDRMPDRTLSASDQVLQALELIENAANESIGELRRLLPAVRLQIEALVGEDDRALALIDEAIHRVEILELSQIGRRRWSDIGDLTEARNRLVHGVAARRGRRDRPDEHAE